MEIEFQKKLTTKLNNSILIASHPRSGTHLFIDLLRRQIPACRGWKWYGLPLDNLYLNIERLVADTRQFSTKKAFNILNKMKKPILKTHALPDFSEWWIENEWDKLDTGWRELINKRMTTFYIYRDPREVFSSYQQFMKGISPEANCTYVDFLKQEHCDTGLTRLEWWKKHYLHWKNESNTHFIKYSDILQNPEKIIIQVGRLINEKPKLKKPYLPNNIQNNFYSRLQRLFFLRPKSTSIIADTAKYKRDDWRDISQDDKKYIHGVVGDILIEEEFVINDKWYLN